MIPTKGITRFSNDINTFFKRFRCPNCDTFIKRAGNFHRHVKSCKDRIQHIYPKSVYNLSETLFDKLDGFGIGYEEEHKLFKNLAVFDFESICVPSNELKDTNTTIWIGKHEQYLCQFPLIYYKNLFSFAAETPRH